MKKWLKTLGVRFLIGAMAGAATALLELEFKFTFPQAVILLAMLLGWWSINRKVDAIKKVAEYLHAATNGLVLPRLTRVERRQRGWNVPEPAEENGKPGEYNDWEMFIGPPAKGENES